MTDTWKMVPLEPTEKMKLAGLGLSANDAARIYKAMLAAAPEQKRPEQKRPEQKRPEWLPMDTAPKDGALLGLMKDGTGTFWVVDLIAITHNDTTNYYHGVALDCGSYIRQNPRAWFPFPKLMHNTTNDEFSIDPNSHLAVTLEEEIEVLKAENERLREALALAPSRKHFDILCEAMAEVKATSDGKSEQPIAEIVAGCLEEIAALEGSSHD